MVADCWLVVAGSGHGREETAVQIYGVRKRGEEKKGREEKLNGKGRTTSVGMLDAFWSTKGFFFSFFSSFLVACERVGT